ncbi:MULTISPECIES: hypothetical protein [unclassified Micromonospora]|uniref:hypothetical protein n=1 Tax=unclassified Micromonospora TaxID=2617518 RepID=UPI00188E6344|nr:MULTISPECIES: hypothetical protein [unclassified Micromonospora]MBF5028517.1 hypothetical protein [Micromonospora sp. ANENR4]MCZ7473011.1 hypothetical protein [Micromonospora sp. WMMC273]WBC03690.1 hypothetical protein O7546_01560 [Micromonospora sp. WMMA1976]
MHVLDDPEGLSPRAQAFLCRAGTRQPEQPRLLTDFVQVPARSGWLIAAPLELTVRREGFAARFGGLRYDVRRSVRIGDERRDTLRCWQFDLLDMVRAESMGWSFAWYGERVSSPVLYLAHTDGRFGVSVGGPFLEVCPSINHLIEGHALMDELHDWEPVPPSSLEAWVPNDITNAHLGEILAALPPVPEASGPHDQWWCSDHLAIRLFHGWTDRQPRPTGVMIWSRNGQI